MDGGTFAVPRSPLVLSCMLREACRPTGTLAAQQETRVDTLVEGLEDLVSLSSGLVDRLAVLYSGVEVGEGEYEDVNQHLPTALESSDKCTSVEFV